MGTLGLTVWKGSLQAMLLGYTLGHTLTQTPGSPFLFISLMFVACMKFRVNRNSGALPRKADFLEPFSCERDLLILFSIHSPPHICFISIPACVISFHLYPNQIYTYPVAFDYNLPFISFFFFPGLILKNKKVNTKSHHLLRPSPPKQQKNIPPL